MSTINRTPVSKTSNHYYSETGSLLRHDQDDEDLDERYLNSLLLGDDAVSSSTIDNYGLSVLKPTESWSERYRRAHSL